MNVYDKANELAQAIKESEQFKKYQAAALEIDKKEEHQKMVKDFMKLQMELANYQYQGEEIPEDLKEKFNTLYSTINNISSVSEFLQAQIYFGIMIEDVSKTISQATDTGANFLKPENFKENE